MSHSAVSWIEVTVLVPEVDAAALEPLDEACLQVSPGGFVVEGADAPPGDVPPPDEGWSRYRVYVGEAELEAARSLLIAACARYAGASVTTAPLAPGWRDRWKAWFHGFEISPRLAVRPPWEDLTARSGQHVVVVEPGMAFGTGQHETTRLCLTKIDALAVSGALPGRVLDVGCGTGILAVAAAQLGAQRIVCVDVDPQAVRATVENAEVNDVAAQVSASTTPIAEVEGTYPLVVANIMAHILIAMAAPLAARVAAGGQLVLSGVLHDQADEVSAAYAAQGVVLDAIAREGNWVRMDMTKAAAR